MTKYTKPKRLVAKKNFKTLNYEHLRAKTNTVTDDKEKISHTNYSRDFLNALFHNVVLMGV